MELARSLGSGRLGVLQVGDQVLLSDSPADAVAFVVAVTAPAVQLGVKAGDLVKAFVPQVGGRGGGKPDMAQGGGSNPAGVPAAIAELRSVLGDSSP